MRRRPPCPLEACLLLLRCNSRLDHLQLQEYSLRSQPLRRLQLLLPSLENALLPHTNSATTVPATVACLLPITSRTSARPVRRTRTATRRASKCLLLNPSNRLTIPQHTLLSADIPNTRKDNSNSRPPSLPTSNKFRRHLKFKHLPNTSLPYSNRSNKHHPQ